MQKRRTDDGWGPGSASWRLSALAGAGLVGLGGNGFLRPGPAAAAFGLPLNDPRDFRFVRVKAARDLATGALPLAFLALGMRRALGAYWVVGALIPAIDATLVVLAGGGKPWQVAQHVGAFGLSLALGTALLRQQD